MKNIIKAKEDLKISLQDVDGINGIGISRTGKGEPYVIVNVKEDISISNKEKIPSEINDVHVKIQTLKSIEFTGRIMDDESIISKYVHKHPIKKYEL